MATLIGTVPKQTGWETPSGHQPLTGIRYKNIPAKQDAVQGTLKKINKLKFTTT